MAKLKADATAQQHSMLCCSFSNVEGLDLSGLGKLALKFNDVLCL
jgi:hypothetical protein